MSSVPSRPRPTLGDDERAALLVRRVAAFFSSVLISPGAGQLAMGRRWRALAWFVVAGLTVLPGPLFSIWAFWANLPLRVLAGADALALSRPERGLPRWGAVLGLWALLMAGTFGLKIGAGQVYMAVVADNAALAPAIETGEQALAYRLDRSAPQGALLIVVDPKDDTKLRWGRVIATAGQRVEVRQGHPWVDGKALGWQAQSGACSFVPPTPPPKDVRFRNTAATPQKPTAPAPRPCHAAQETLAGLSYRVLAAEPSAAGVTLAPRVVPAGQVFVLGDNRAVGAALVGMVPLQRVVGRLRTIWWSANAQGLRWDRIGRQLR